MTTIDSNLAKTIQQFYVAYFNRPADVGGLNFWASVITSNGGSTALISAEFAKSAEYADAFRNKSSYEIVDQIYHNLFGRAPEPSGLAFWGLALDLKKISIDNAVTQIAAGAQGSDATAFNNKVTASGLFTSQLDSSANILAYSGAAAIQVAKDYVTSVTDDASLANATTPAALSTVVTNLIAAHDQVANSPQSFVLTENFDSFVPVAGKLLKGNDTFTSNDPTGNPTLNAFDSLDGGDGIDTIKVTSAGTLAIPASATVKNIETAELRAGGTLSGDVSTWTGLTKVTATSSGGLSLTAAATTGLTLAEAVSAAATTTVVGGSTVSVAVTGTTTGAISVSNGAGALTFTHAGGGATAGATTTINKTTGNVTSTETGTTSTANAEGKLTISNTTGSVVATRSGTGGGDITISGTTGAVAVTNTYSSNAGDITVTGGTTINVTQANSNDVATTVTNGLVTVNGTAATTSVVVNNATKATASATVAGVNLDEVRIADVNKYVAAKDSSATGTITSVTVTGFTTLSIADTALTTLNVTGGTSNIVIDNRPNVDTTVTPNVTAATAKTLGLTVNGQTGGTLSDQGQYTTLNVTTAGTATSKLALSASALTALNVAGTKGLDIGAGSALAKVTAVTVTGGAGISGNFSDTTTNFKALTSISATGTGTSTVTIDGAKTAFTGGAGVENVTLSATASSKAIVLGAGDDSIDVTSATALTSTVDGGTGTDSLKITAALAATASADAKFAGQVTGFESLVLTGSTNQTVDLAVLGNFNKVTTSGGNGLTLSNLPTGGNLILNGPGTAYTVSNSAFTSGAADVVNVTLTDPSGASVSFGTLTAANVETVNITTVDGQDTPSGTFLDVFSVAGNTAKSIVISGNAGLNLATTTDTAATLVDASGITLGGFTWNSGALAAASTVKGSATGTNTVDLTAAVAKAITYTGGTGFDDLKLGANSSANSFNLGSGTTNNTLAGGTSDGANTVNSTATGTDTVTLGNGANIVSLGNGANTFTAGSGGNTYTGGTGVDTITLGIVGATKTATIGQNLITTGTGADVVVLDSVSVNGNTYSIITDAHSKMAITFNDANIHGTETFNQTKVPANSDTATFDSFLAAASVSATAGTNSILSWFQFNGNTYIVEDNSNAVTYQNGVDTVLRLNGLVDLSTAGASFAGTTITLI